MEKTKLLYIEDDDAQRRTLAKELRARGLNVTVAASARTGIALFSSRRFDAILCGLDMPGMGGLDVLEQVRQEDPDIPFLILAAHGEISQAVRAIKKGASDILLKPPGTSEIVMTIKHAMEQSHLQRELRRSRDTLVRDLEERTSSLEKANRALQAVFDAAQSPIFLVDTEGIIQAANKDVPIIFGLPKEEVLGENYRAVIERIKDRFENPPAFLRLIDRLEAAPDREDTSVLAELYKRGLTMKGPKQLILAPVSLCVADEEGRPAGRVWCYNDITASKYADEQVNTIVKSLPVPTIVSRFEDGKVIYVNEEMAHLIGLPAQELVGRYTSEFYYDPGERNAVKDRLIKDGSLKNFEIRIKKADGSFMWMLVSLVLAQLGGEPVIIGGLNDISERKTAEEALRRERNFVSAVLDTVGALVLVLDLEGRVVRFNRACEEVTGYSQLEVLGRAFDDFLLVPEEVERVRALFRRLRDGEYPLRGENYWLTKSGERRLISWSNTVLLEDHGQVEYVVATGIDITEHRKAYDRMMLYRELFMNAADGIAIVDPEGRFMERNPAHRQVTGLTDEELAGKTVLDMMFREHNRILEELMRDGHFRGEVAIHHKEGDVRSVDLSVFPILSGSGSPLAYAGISRDITARKRAEEAIATRLRYEEGLSNCSRILLAGAMAEADLAEALRSLLTTARVSRVSIYENYVDEVDGLCARLVHEATIPGVASGFDDPDWRCIPYKAGFDRWREKLERQELVKAVDVCPLPDSLIMEGYEAVSILLIPINADGKWYGFLGFHDTNARREWNGEDIQPMRMAAEIIGTYLEKKRFMEALRVSEERFRSLVENANEVIYSLTPRGEFSYLSPKFVETMGYEVSEWLGRPVYDLMHPDDRVEMISWIQGGLKVNPGEVYEFRLLHKNGSLRWFVTNGSIIHDDKGNVLEVIGVAHDITDMKKVLEDLERANRELRETQLKLIQADKMASLGMLVAGIAHEINTPIGAVSSMHDTLFRTIDKLKEIIETYCPRGHESYEQAESSLKVIEDSKRVIKPGTDRVINIVRRLRSFARLDEAILKTVDIHEGLEDTLTLIHHELKHNITVTKNYGEVPPIACFPGQLNQVFLNILINAKQAIRGEGAITISTYVADGKVHIAIRDNGIGIPKEQLTKIFDPGFTTKGVGVGTGLGLSICYQIIQDHLGEIKVESEVGKGSTFTIILPADLDRRLGGE